MDEKAKQRFRTGYVLRDDCWVWIRGCFSDGYGAFGLDGKTRRAHRVAYEFSYGVILSSDQLLHHKCGNKLCVNPRHMEMTNQIDHVDSAIFGNKQKTHCPHGHEYTSGNICWNRRGTSRECRVCKYQRMRRQYQRRKQQVQQRLKELALKYQSHQ